MQRNRINKRIHRIKKNKKRKEKEKKKTYRKQRKENKNKNKKFKTNKGLKAVKGYKEVHLTQDPPHPTYHKRFFVGLTRKTIILIPQKRPSMLLSPPLSPSPFSPPCCLYLHPPSLIHPLLHPPSFLPSSLPHKFKLKCRLYDLYERKKR